MADRRPYDTFRYSTLEVCQAGTRTALDVLAALQQFSGTVQFSDTI